MRETHKVGATYTVSVNYTSYSDSSISVSVNNEFVSQNVVLPKGSGVSSPLQFTIYNGLNILELRSTTTKSSTFQINQVIVTLVQAVTQPYNDTCVETTTTSTSTTSGTTGSTTTTTSGTTTSSSTTTTGSESTSSTGGASNVSGTTGDTLSSATKFETNIFVMFVILLLCLQ